MNLLRAAILGLTTGLLLAGPQADWSQVRAASDRLQTVAPGVLRSSGLPAAHVLVDNRDALIIGCPDRVTPADLQAHGIETCKLVLLTHHHRDSSAGADRWIARGAAVRAPTQSAAWLEPAGVEAFWSKSLPEVLPGQFPPLFHRQWAVWAYWMLPEGIQDVQCNLADGQELKFGAWTIRVVATPGHSPDHVAYVAETADGGAAGADKQRIVFCGDAICAPGKIWTPYTTDWHHANADGLNRAAESLRRLAALQPTLLCPEHGPPLRHDIQDALEAATRNLQHAAMLKSFEQFRKETQPDAPLPAFVAPEQVSSATPAGNVKPWTRLSPHLFLTGNTYALASAEGPVLLVDPYDRGLRDRLNELKQTFGFGPAEVALISHAHNDHYTGLFALADEPGLKVWVLDRIADAVSAPKRVHAPYVDPRPVRVDRRLEPGEIIRWREYTLRIEHQPGQTDLAMSLEVEVDGRRVMFTGDNFYRADQYTGSGGWSGLNRGLPGGYAASAGKIVERAPAWILAEHGGAMAFDRADFELRGRWAQAAARAADALSPSGNHRQDWDPHRVRIEPVRLAAIAGQPAQVELVCTNPTESAQRMSVALDPRAGCSAAAAAFTAPPGADTRRPLAIELAADLAPGRHVLTFSATVDDGPEPADIFVVLDVAEPGKR